MLESARSLRTNGARAPLLAAVLLTLLGADGEFPEFADDPSAFTTVIEAKQYDDRFATLGDVLDHVAGVQVRRTGGLGSFSTASIRGAESERVLILLDGVRLNSASRGNVDLSSLPLRMIERIEVVRGGGSAQFGSSAVGGVISITSRGPESEPGVDVSGVVGDLGTLGGDALVSAHRGRLSTLLAYNRLESDNDYRFRRFAGVSGYLDDFSIGSRRTREGADFLEQTGFARVNLQIGPERRISGTTNLYKRSGGQPGSTNRAPLGWPDEGVSCPYADERYRRGILDLSFFDEALGPGSLQARGFFRHEHTSLHDPGGSCGLILPFVRGTDRLEGTENEAGLEATYQSRRHRLGPFELRSRSSASFRGNRWRGDDVDDTGQWIGSLFVQEEIALFDRRLRLFPAIGMESTRTERTTVAIPGTGVETDVRPDDGVEWLPRIGAILKLVPGLRLKTNYSKAYRRPTFEELFLPDQGYVRGNPNLRSETAWNFDIGVEARYPSLGFIRDVRFEAAYFHRDLEDPIEFVLIDHFTVAPVNLSTSRIQGGEFSMGLFLLERIELSASYTRMKAEVKRTGGSLPHRPRNRFTGRSLLHVGSTQFWADITSQDSVGSGIRRIGLEAQYLGPSGSTKTGPPLSGTSARRISCRPLFQKANWIECRFSMLRPLKPSSTPGWFRVCTNAG